jgi:molybdate transport system substrate-binding protein
LFAWSAKADDLLVFAASSLKGSLDKVANDWQLTHGTQVLVSYGGSAAMAKQILAGAPADIFMSAAPEWMEAVSGTIVADTRVDLLSNTLVLVGPKGAAPVDPVALAAALGDGKLAIGMVGSVPAGQYGRAALTHLGVWAQVRGSLAETENVRAALTLVAIGEAAYGIVYASDAAAEPRVTVVARFDPQTHPRILYQGAIIAPEHPDAASFLLYLQSPAAQKIFVDHGFIGLAEGK